MKLKKSNRIYEEIKKFYDINPKGIYPYQNLDEAGKLEYSNKCSDETLEIEKWQKLNLSIKLTELIELICKEEKSISDLEVFAKETPIIFYYDSYINYFKAWLDKNSKYKENYADLFKEILRSTTSKDIVKLTIVSAAVIDDDDLYHMIKVFTCHNEYIFYCLVAMKKKNKNDEIFSLCQTSVGYGRPLCIMSLNVTDSYMRKWLIEDGLDSSAGINEILKYTLLSYNFSKYIEEIDYDAESFEKIAMYIGKYLFGEYDINELDEGISISLYIINKVEEHLGGIYSLYCIVMIMNYLEELLLYDSSGKSKSLDEEIIIKYKKMLYDCRNICRNKKWHDVLSEELKNLDIDADILLSCSERVKYKIKKSEFKDLFIRNSDSPLIYNYAFSSGNKSLERFILNEGLKKLDMDYILSGQDSLHIENIKYNEIQHICYFIIISNIKFNGNEDIYKEINIAALSSPVIETRKYAIENLNIIKEILDDYDKDSIIEIKDREVSSAIREELDVLIGRKNYKRKNYINVDKYMIIKPHVKDVLLTSMEIEGNGFIDMSEINNELNEKSIVYIVKGNKNSDISTVTTYNGYVIGYLSKTKEEVLCNLVEADKYIYGAVKSINEDYSKIVIDVYLSYQDVIDEIESTLSLLSGYGKTDLLQ